ncbi:MAG: CBS domain-containing protein [Hyphomicrobium sp.]|nr:CBS domain-containing protein [Hyphomicrobium sp.]
MIVAKLMTRSVLFVAPDTPVRTIAHLLVEHGISAVPVADNGEPVGIVSETDLVARKSSSARDRGWLSSLLKSDGNTHQAFVDVFRSDLTARDVMTSPVITVQETADLSDVLRLMIAHSVKRLPVVKNHRITGIISRADLLRALANTHIGEHSAARKTANPFYALDALFSHRHANDAEPAPPLTVAHEAPPVISAAAFRGAIDEFKMRSTQSAAIERRRSAERHTREIEAILDAHANEDFWRQMLLNARTAASNGLVEIEVLRFPADACSDNGRMINNAEHDWASTLRGQPAEIWHRWLKELKPQGFHLAARIVNYPDGMPGDIGLFLIWGHA